MNNMNLVQRGEFKNLSGITLWGKNGVIDLDYMGYAEYEFGSVPSSYKRMLQSPLTITTMDPPYDKTKYGVPLNILASDKNIDSAKTMLLRYLEDRKDPHKIPKIMLKAYIGFENRAFDRINIWSNRMPTDNFWHDIEHDFMFFYGCHDRITAIRNAITNDILIDSIV